MNHRTFAIFAITLVSFGFAMKQGFMTVLLGLFLTLSLVSINQGFSGAWLGVFLSGVTWLLFLAMNIEQLIWDISDIRRELKGYK